MNITPNEIYEQISEFAPVPNNDVGTVLFLIYQELFKLNEKLQEIKK